MNVQDTAYAPAGDMFESGSKVQVPSINAAMAASGVPIPPAAPMRTVLPYRYFFIMSSRIQAATLTAELLTVSCRRSSVYEMT
jgi:DMSO/TMAO reductase YedYZ molybdopterin-dependent catalytic subunit